MDRLLHPSHQAAGAGRTIGTPRRYSLVTGLLFLGRRRAAMMRLARAAGVGAGARVLDVGCGDGLLTSVAAALAGPTGEAIGLDASPEMIQWASRRHPEADFVAGSADSLPMDAAEFDVVTCSLVLHHLPRERRAAAVAEMARVVKPGGRVLLAEVSAPSSGPLALVGHLHGLDRMAREAPDLLPLLDGAGLVTAAEAKSGPWIRYAVGVKPPA